MSGDEEAGRLVGRAWGTDTNIARITDSYATGAVSGDEDVGGLVRSVIDADITSSYWDTESTGQSDAVGTSDTDGATGLTTDEMTGYSADDNMDALDFGDVWEIRAGDYPGLRDVVNSGTG